MVSSLQKIVTSSILSKEMQFPLAMQTRKTMKILQSNQLHISNSLCERQRQWTSLTFFENPSRSSPPMGLTQLFIIEVSDILCETVGDDRSEFKCKFRQDFAVFSDCSPQNGEILDIKSHWLPCKLFTTTCSLQLIHRYNFFKSQLLVSSGKWRPLLYSKWRSQATCFPMKFPMKFWYIPEYPSYKLVQLFIHFGTFLFTEKVPMYLCTT